MQRVRLNTHRNDVQHAYAVSKKAYVALYPSSPSCQIEDSRAAPCAHSYATSTTADRKKQKFLQKRLSGGHISISRSSIKRIDKSEDEIIIDFFDFSETEKCPATFAALLRSCAKRKLRTSGMFLHHHIIRDGLDGILVLQNLLVQMYNECELMYDASCLFSSIHFRDEFVWNFMIRACSQFGGVAESTQMFNMMLAEGVAPNKFCYTSLLLAYSSPKDLAESKRVLSRLVGISFEADALLENALLSMWCKCAEDLGDVRQLFDRLYEQDSVSWNAMIAAHSKQGRGDQALYYFKQMQQTGVLPNEPTFVSVLDACTDGSVMFEGRCLHACFAGTDLERDLVLGTTLVNMYGKQGVLSEARRVFDQMQEQNTVSWNAMITAYVLDSQGKETLVLFHQMLQQGIMPDKFVLVSMFSAHAMMEDLADGIRMYSRLFGMDLNSDAVVLTAVLNMFCKCGSMKDAGQVFDMMKNADVVAWTSMIDGYAQHGQGRKAFQLFKRMQLQGPNPCQVTYTSVLSACSREGLVEEGVRHLLSMSREHGMKPSMDHYNCVVDLLARSGQLDEAEDLIASMSADADCVSWTSLLDACRKQADVERGYRVVNRIFELGSIGSSSLVLLSNLTAASQST